MKKEDNYLIHHGDAEVHGGGGRDLPEGWQISQIGDIAELDNGRAFKPEEWGKSGLPIIRIQNLNSSNSEFNYSNARFPERFKVSRGDLLFAWSGTPGTFFGAHIWTGGDAWLNQHIFNVRFFPDKANRNFLRYAINQKLEELIGNAQGGVGLRHVTKGTFESTLIPLPPLPEQERIAARLDLLLGKLKAARKRLDGMPELIKRFRKSVLAEAVSGRLTEEWREEKSISSL